VRTAPVRAGLEDDDADVEAVYEREIGLPLRAENYATGEPLVTVDCFGFERPRRDAVVEALQGLEHSTPDPGAAQPRFLLLEGRRPDGRYQALDLVAILTVRATETRVATARSDVTERVRHTVQRALGATVRYLRRVRENPVAETLRP